MTPLLQSALSSAGPDAEIISRLWWLLFGGCSVLFVVVAVLVFASLRNTGWRSRSRMLVVGGGVLLPAPLLAALMAWSGWQAHRLTWPHSATAIHVTVTARMWWWEVRYRDTRSGREAVLANELHLPVGRPVYLALTSGDVMHTFWVPALAGKVDMLPGRMHGLVLRADAPGTYRGQCAEFCGIQHANMALTVTAEPPADFDAWLAHQAAPAAPGAGPELRRGAALFVSARCVSCHSVRGVADGGTLGPDLTHLASRSHIAAGALPMTHAGLLGWIGDPQAAKPGVHMPASSLPPDDLQALAAWLGTLR